MGFSLKKFGKTLVDPLGLGYGDAIFGSERMRGARSMDPNAFQWDPRTGMPIGLNQMPEGESALLFQQKANEIAAERNASLREEAMTYLNQGARASETYRPGGFASYGFYGARSQLSMASMIEAPDMLMGYREYEKERALFDQRQAARQMQLSSLLQFAGTIGGALIGGGAGAAIGGTVGGQVGQGGDAMRTGTRERVLNEPYF